MAETKKDTKTAKKEKHYIVREDQHRDAKEIAKCKGMTMIGLMDFWIKSTE